MIAKQAVGGTDVELRGISKNTLVYSVGNVAVKAVSFLLIPLYTNYLTVHAVGIVVLLELLEMLYNYVTPLGAWNGLWRYFYPAKKEGNEDRFVSSLFFFVILANVAILALLVLASTLTAEYYLSDVSLTRLVQLFFVASFFGLSRLFILQLFRLYERAALTVVIQFVDFSLLILLNLWFVIGLDLGLMGIVYAKLITAALLFIFSMVYVVRQHGTYLHFQDISISLRFGFPLVLQGISLLILMMSDRYFIKELVSVAAAGIYGIAYKFGMIISMVLVTPFTHAWQPILFRLENTPNQKLTYQRVALHYLQISMVVWVFIVVGTKYLVYLTTPEQYYPGIIIIPWIAFSYLLYGLQTIFKAGALLKNETVKMMAYTVLAAILNIVLNILLIPRWGILGAAVATVLSYLVMMLMVLLLSQRNFYVNYRWKKMIFILLIGIVFGGLGMLELENVLINGLKDFVSVILLPLLLIAFGLVSVSEVKRFLKRRSVNGVG